eukprot:243691-Amphidinium_carterae.1
MGVCLPWSETTVASHDEGCLEGMQSTPGFPGHTPSARTARRALSSSAESPDCYSFQQLLFNSVALCVMCSQLED